MAGDKTDVVVIGVPKKLVVNALSGPFNLHLADDAKQAEALLASVGPRIRGAAVTGAPRRRT